MSCYGSKYSLNSYANEGGESAQVGLPACSASHDLQHLSLGSQLLHPIGTIPPLITFKSDLLSFLMCFIIKDFNLFGK